MQLCRDPLWLGGKHWKATLRESTPLLGQERESWQWRSENVVNCGRAGNAMRDTLWNWDNLRHSSSSSTLQVECCWKDKDQVLATPPFFLKHLYSNIICHSVLDGMMNDEVDCVQGWFLKLQGKVVSVGCGGVLGLMDMWCLIGWQGEGAWHQGTARQIVSRGGGSILGRTNCA